MSKMTMMGLALLTIGLGGMAGAQEQGAQTSNLNLNLCSLLPSAPGCPPPTTNGGNYDQGGNNDPAQLYEDITVTVPAVVAMHLHETSWNINLSNLEGQNCRRAGDHSTETGRDYTYPLMDILRASSWKGDGKVVQGNDYSFVGNFTLPSSLAGFSGNPSSLMAAQTSYPGIVFRNGDRRQVDWKGPMICFNQKIVQKFSNARNGWTFRAEVQGKNGGAVPAGFPSFILGDQVANSSVKKVEMLYNAANATRTPLQVSNTDLALVPDTGRATYDLSFRLRMEGDEPAGQYRLLLTWALEAQ